VVLKPTSATNVILADQTVPSATAMGMLSGGADVVFTSRATPAPIAYVQSKTATANNTTISATFDAAPTQNNLLIAICGYNNSGDVIDTPSGWSVAINETGSSPSEAIFYKIAGASEASTVTVTKQGVTRQMALLIYEYSGIATSSPLDKTASSPDDATDDLSIASGTTATTTQADELLLAVLANPDGFRIGSWTNSFVERNDFGGSMALAGAERIVSSTGTYSTAGSLGFFGNNARGQIVTFKGRSWSETNTQRASIGLLIDGADDGASGQVFGF
jgi:hypothetical protein